MRKTKKFINHNLKIISMSDLKRKHSSGVGLENSLIKRRKTRTSLELIQKWEIACECETRRTGDVAAEYGLPLSTVSTIKNSRDKLKEMMAKNLLADGAKNIRSSSFPDLEQALAIWIREVKSFTNESINGVDIRTKALYFANRFGYTNFKASNGWLDNFKQRNQSIFKSLAKNEVRFKLVINQFKP